MRRIYIKRSRRWIFGVGFLVIIVCGIMYYNTLKTKVETRARKETLESLTNTRQNLLQEQEELQKQWEASQEGDGVSEEEIIRIAREKLGLVFDEEIIITPNE